MRRHLFVLALGLVPGFLGAQGRVVSRGCMPLESINGRPRPPVRLPCSSQEQVVRTASNVSVRLDGRVLRYEVEERFVNRGGRIGEADYIFPLPKNAAFQDLKLSINGEMVAGETLGADEARRIYEEIVRRQRDPALVEWMGAGLLRLRIFPLPPGEERRIVVRFTAVAEREGDAVRVDYRRGTAEQRRGTRDAGRGGESEASIRLSYDRGAGFGDAYSPTHELTRRDRGGEREVVARGDGDVTILVPVRRSNAASIAAITQGGSGEDGFALITVTPPAESRRATTPRDVTFVMDVSGSMSGEKLRQAKAAGAQLLASLRPSDRFRIIAFSSDVRTFEDEFTRATPEAIRAARRYIDSLDATGGTNISGALAEALRVASPSGRLPLVVFLTDGEPTVGSRDPRDIAEQAARQRKGARVYTFGVGSDVNAALLEQLALEGRGTAQFVRPSEDVERVVGLVASRLVDPLLTDVRVRGEGVRLSRLMPEQGADLFAGQELVVLGRYSGSGRGRVIVEGRGPDGPVRWTQDVDFAGGSSSRGGLVRDNSFVPRLWATQRVGWLSAERRRMQMDGVAQQGSRASLTEVEAEIRALGERYGIPTELTSYFVKEPGMAMPMSAGVGGTTRGMPAPMPAAPPAAQAAAEKFEQARRASAMRSARSVNAMEAEDASSGVAESQAALGRTFSRDERGAWTDRRDAAGMRVVKVKAYSEAYFALLRAMPELQEVLAMGKVRMTGRGIVLEVGDDGEEVVRDEEVGAIVRALKDTAR